MSVRPLNRSLYAALPESRFYHREDVYAGRHEGLTGDDDGLEGGLQCGPPALPLLGVGGGGRGDVDHLHGTYARSPCQIANMRAG